MRLFVSLLAPCALLLSVGCSHRSDSADADSAHSVVTMSHAVSAASSDQPLRAGDVRIVTADSGVDLALIGDSISSGLSQHSLTKVRQETDTAKVSGSGFSASLEKMVKGTVASAVGTRVSFPVSALRDVRYADGAIVFEWTGKRPTMFDNTKVNNKKLLESFPPDDAQRFVTAVKARMAERGNI